MSAACRIRSRASRCSGPGGTSAVMARQSNWDPFLFTGECEQAHFGETESLPELITLQRAEFEVLFDYCWRQSALE